MLTNKTTLNEWMFEIQTKIRVIVESGDRSSSVRSCLVRGLIDWLTQALYLVGALLLLIGLFMVCASVAVNALRPSTLDVTPAGSATISAGTLGEWNKNKGFSSAISVSRIINSNTTWRSHSIPLQSEIRSATELFQWTPARFIVEFGPFDSGLRRYVGYFKTETRLTCLSF